MREWTTVDKSAWGTGEWQGEADKVQWVDERTGLDCLIHRGPSGALCGYVGVTDGHPLFGVDYSACAFAARGETCPDAERGWMYCDHSPCMVVRVHGGLTYSDFCQHGKDESRGICHIPEPGRPDRVWWLGFDCAHSGDLCPAHSRYGLGVGERYRDRAYVEDQCRQLARQLAALATPNR